MGTVRDKLQEDAKKDNLMNEVDDTSQPPIDMNVQGNRGQRATAPQKKLVAKEYRGEL